MHSFPLSLFCVGTVGTVGTPHKQGLSALPLLFEQWEQWEQNSGQTAFFAHFRAGKPATSPTARAPSVQISKDPDAPFGAFLDFSARRGFVPAPHGRPGWPGPGMRKCTVHACARSGGQGWRYPCQMRRTPRAASSLVLASWQVVHSPCTLLASSAPPSARALMWSRWVASVTRP